MINDKRDRSREGSKTEDPVEASGPSTTLTGPAVSRDASDPQPAGPLPRPFGRYRLDEEVARGGMGVVFRAWQETLRRTVALKMILAGRFAGDEDVRRFRAEAEAAARLDHPHIVPIHDVGQIDGQHYFTMGFVEGPSLAECLREGPLPPRDAARLVGQVADAVHHAHQHGVIHRDLKPANILLAPGDVQPAPNALADRSDTPAALVRTATAKVTDFGLAKSWEGPGELTATGQILGTPGYMSPEQASGRGRAVGPRSDVYALGAVLYAALTGRPPFQAATSLETLSQVVNQDPAAPSQLNAGVPRDLDTICLKCLEKDPARRYATAEELSADLGRFRDGEPIRARPVGAAEQLWRTMWKQRRSVAITTISVLATMAVAALLSAAGYSYSRWRLGAVSLLTDRPPLTAEIFDARGRAAGNRSAVPTVAPVELPAGDYRLRLSSPGRLSQEYHALVPRRRPVAWEVNLEDRQLWPTLEVERTYDLATLDGRSSVIEFTDSGLRRWDGKVTWSCDLTAENALPPEASAGFRWPWTDDSRGAQPRAGAGRGKLDFRPRAVPLPDADGDGRDDLLLVARHQAWLLALSGARGEPLWFAGRGADVQQSEAGGGRGLVSRTSTVVGLPHHVPDADGDDLPDLLVTLADATETAAGQGTPVPNGRDTVFPARRWIELVSSSSGKTIWRHELQPQDPHAPAFQEPPYGTRWFLGGNLGVEHTGGGQQFAGETRRGRGNRRQRHLFGHLVALPWPVECVQDGERRLAVVLDGARLTLLDCATGQTVTAPRTLPFVPQRAAVMAELDGVAPPELLLVAPAPNKSGQTAGKGAQTAGKGAQTAGKGPQTAGKGIGTMLVAWSLEHEQVLWRKTLDADDWLAPSALAPRASWPLAVDLDRDQRDEVLVPNGTSASDPRAATPWGKLDVLEGATGEVRWSRTLRTMDEQLDCFLPGPDVNGDGFREVFVASLTEQHEETWLYVDCLSGENGRSRWWNRQRVDAPGGGHGLPETSFWLGRPQWWDTSSDGRSSLIVPVVPDPWDAVRGRPAAYLFAARDGRLEAMGPDMEQIQLADADGDGRPDLFAFRPWGVLDRGGRLDAMAGMPFASWRRLGGGTYGVGPDADGDGLSDALLATGDGRLMAVSSIDGRQVWQSQALEATEPRAVPLPDVNGDFRGDVFVAPAHSFGAAQARSPYRVLCGASGKTLWQAPLQVRSAEAPVLVEPRDLDADGRPELLVAGKCDWQWPASGRLSPSAGQLWLFVFDGSSGRIRWQQPLAGQSPRGAGPGAAPGRPFQLRIPYRGLPLATGDLNLDGVSDVLVPAERDGQANRFEVRALDGRDGSLLWRRELASGGQPGAELQLTGFDVGDVEGDGKTDVVLLEYAGQVAAASQGGRPSIQLRLLRGDNGAPLWEWNEEVPPTLVRAMHGEFELRHRPRPQVIHLRGAEPTLIAVNVWGTPDQIVLLDRQGAIAGRTTVDADGTLQLWPLDINGDGTEELLVFDRTGVRALRPPENETLWHVPLKRGAADEILAILNSPLQSAPVVVVRHGSTLLEINASIGLVISRCDGPRARRGPAELAARVIPLVAHGRVETGSWMRSDLGVAPPISVVYTYGDAALARMLVSKIGGRAALPRAAAWMREQDDPRRFRQLPWVQELSLTAHRDDDRLAMQAWGLLLSLLLLVIPGLYLAYLVRRRRWSLSAVLLLPLVVGLVLLALSIPAPEQRWPWELTGRRRLGWAVAMLPYLLFPALLVAWSVGRKWWRVGGWLLATVFIALGLAALVLWLDRSQAGPGWRYDWAGWYSILWAGVFTAGWLMLPVTFVWQLARRFVAGR